MTIKSLNTEIAKILSDLSGVSFENCLSKVRTEHTVDTFGGVDMRALQSVAGDLHISSSTLASRLSKESGLLFEDAIRKVNAGIDPMRPTYRHGWGDGK